MPPLEPRRAGRGTHALGIPAAVLFPAIAANLKTSRAEEAWNPEGLIPRAIPALKDALPEVMVVTDVALDPYNADGQDGRVAPNGPILNDETVDVLCRQALCHAEAGAAIVSPSDMMDGRVGAIRNALDQLGYEDVSILSYTAKYASGFCGPFRGALDSAPSQATRKPIRWIPPTPGKQLSTSTRGADILMVKLAGPYLDVISLLRQHFDLPIAAYQVSGEYLMLKSAAAAGWLDEKTCVLESLTGIRRAGADMILTYFAKDAEEWLVSRDLRCGRQPEEAQEP